MNDTFVIYGLTFVLLLVFSVLSCHISAIFTKAVNTDNANTKNNVNAQNKTVKCGVNAKIKRIFWKNEKKEFFFNFVYITKTCIFLKK